MLVSQQREAFVRTMLLSLLELLFALVDPAPQEPVPTAILVPFSSFFSPVVATQS
jgi:hypothetical protein